MKIEKNIPMPAPKSNRQKWQELLETWKVTDSVVLETLYESAALRLAPVKARQRITQRQEENGKIRIWRVK